MRAFLVTVALCVTAAASAFTIWYLYSPQWAVSHVIDSAIDGNVEGLISSIDFDRFRESMKAEVHANLARVSEQQSDPDFLSVTTKAFDVNADSKFSAAAVRTHFSSTHDLNKGLFGDRMKGGSITRDTFDQFTLRLKTGENIFFGRDGFSWKIVGIHFSDATAAQILSAMDDPVQTAQASKATPVETVNNVQDDSTRSVPVQFHGLWAPDAEHCGPEDTNTSKMFIDAKNIGFYEERNHVDLVTTVNEGDQYLAKVTSESEGEIGGAKVLLHMVGQTLIITSIGVNEPTPDEAVEAKDGSRWVRCPSS